jgi:S-adenosyl methyltransferase
VLVDSGDGTGARGPGQPVERTKLDLDRPNAARMYDYYLGGSANVAVDREAADELLAAFPDLRHVARANRAFLGRAVRHLAEQGIDQFLDLGSGIPTAGNVHEIAHQVNPAARVAYVDTEPVAVSYARKLLVTEPAATITQADIREPATVLGAPGVAGLLDFRRPVAVLLVAVLPALSDAEDPAGLLATYRDACAPGSHLVLSHLSPLTVRHGQIERTEAVYARTPTPVRYRGKAEITAFLAGYELLPPGLVPLPNWHPTEHVSDHDAARANSYGAVGRLP